MCDVERVSTWAGNCCARAMNWTMVSSRLVLISSIWAIELVCLGTKRMVGGIMIGNTT